MTPSETLSRLASTFEAYETIDEHTRREFAHNWVQHYRELARNLIAAGNDLKQVQAIDKATKVEAPGLTSVADFGDGFVKMRFDTPREASEFAVRVTVGARIVDRAAQNLRTDFPFNMSIADVAGVCYAQGGNPHDLDKYMVGMMASHMKRRMGDARRKGRDGWHDPKQCRADELSARLRRALGLGNLVDVANYAAMIHARRESYVPAAPVAADPSLTTVSRDVLKQLNEEASNWAGVVKTLDALDHEDALDARMPLWRNRNKFSLKGVSAITQIRLLASQARKWRAGDDTYVPPKPPFTFDSSIMTLVANDALAALTADAGRWSAVRSHVKSSSTACVGLSDDRVEAVVQSLLSIRLKKKRPTIFDSVFGMRGDFHTGGYTGGVETSIREAAAINAKTPTFEKEDGEPGSFKLHYDELRFTVGGNDLKFFHGGKWTWTMPMDGGSLSHGQNVTLTGLTGFVRGKMGRP